MPKFGVAIIPITIGSVGKNATVYSRGENYEKLRFERATGYTCMWVKSTAGQVTISQQCSLDGEAWYDPVDSAGNPLGVVVSGLTVTTGKYIQFTPVLAKYSRFKVVEANVAATTVTAELVMQERL